MFRRTITPLIFLALLLLFVNIVGSNVQVVAFQLWPFGTIIAAPFFVWLLVPLLLGYLGLLFRGYLGRLRRFVFK